ncbi:hypothetical protein [Chryseobacterium sp. ERMR1:04]|uniref:hypothetical protein n=1 Tax=Chryseobacterium sp. ERMR1:04 TaxID=1705393 RepID=UPI0006C89168|nr:hypothetical protein [Chryseobacterium sp. ERMR1:04]KPH11984.1 hypothetical protein AMQ68_21830 [Chryseobacterium sp. ERMR1:04]
MKYSFIIKRIFFILLFYFSALDAQKILVINNSDESITVNNRKKDIVIKDRERKEISNINDRISLKNNKNLDRFINLFLDPTDTIIITIKKDDGIIYTGNQAAIHEYLNERLNIETFGKMNIYQNVIEKKNIEELKNTSELLILDVMKKVKLSSLLFFHDDKEATKKLKNHIKYNWLYTIFSTIDREEKNKTLKKEVINYYYKKYIESDIPQYSCNGFFQYHVIQILAKNKNLLQIKMPIYPIIENTDEDKFNQFLPKNCQKYYFLGKYQYLDHIDNPQKEYYKKVLSEKFND